MSEAVISAFNWVPDFAKGLVRDLRIRWACEEIGKSYTTHLLNAREPRDEEYRKWQPFGQVPAFEENGLRLFESGAILLYLGDEDERLLPGDAEARWAATSWLIAGLNSIEPLAQRAVTYDVFHADKDWSKDARASIDELIRSRLAGLSEALDDKEWLAGSFSVADIVMVTVLRILRHCDLLDEYPNLAAYKARGEARPAFQRALAAQLADFEDQPTTPA